MAEYIEREAIEKAVLTKQERERQHWIEYLNRFRATADYSSKEQAVDNWLRGYGEAVENLLAIFETIPATDVVEVVRCKDCTYCSEHYNICHYGVGRDVKPDHYCGYGERRCEE